jgi:hypothetical protein
MDIFIWEMDIVIWEMDIVIWEMDISQRSTSSWIRP